MKSKSIALLFSAFLLPFLVYAIGPYKAGDQLTVHAISGLVLRETASPSGKKIRTLEYGTTVTVLADGLKKTPHSVELTKGYSIRGYWVKVRSGEGKEGFVFDGYLSRYKIPASLPNDLDPNDPEGIMTLTERYLVLNSPRKGEKVDLQKYETTYQRFRQAYANGDEVEVNTGEGGSEYAIRFHKPVTIEEAYLIGKELWFGMSDMNAKTSLRKGNLVLNSEDGLMEAEVASKDGFVYLFLRRAD